MLASDIIDDLKARAKALRLTKKELAALADLDETTVGRVFAGATDPLIGTLDKLQTAITVEEHKLRRQLADRACSAGDREELS